MGASLKMVMDQLLGTVMATFAEGLVLGESLGLSRKVLFEALLGGPAAAPLSRPNASESKVETTRRRTSPCAGCRRICTWPR